MKVLGVDPGVTGALVLLDSDAMTLEVIDMPTVPVKRGKTIKNEVNGALLASYLAGLTPIDAAYIEQVGAMPGQGVTSVFSFGRSVGVVEGVLGALNVPTFYVHPKVWQKPFQVRSKDDSRARAIQRYPTYAQSFARKKDDGRADAALVATYGYELSKSLVG